MLNIFPKTTFNLKLVSYSIRKKKKWKNNFIYAQYFTFTHPGETLEAFESSNQEAIHYTVVI